MLINSSFVKNPYNIVSFTLHTYNNILIRRGEIKIKYFIMDKNHYVFLNDNTKCGRCWFYMFFKIAKVKRDRISSKKISNNTYLENGHFK